MYEINILNTICTNTKKASIKTVYITNENVKSSKIYPKILEISSIYETPSKLNNNIKLFIIKWLLLTIEQKSLSNNKVLLKAK